MAEHILNPESIIRHDRAATAGRPRSSGQSLIGRSDRRHCGGEEGRFAERKRRLIEMACVDGAVVFDDDNLLAVGALIRSHPAWETNWAPEPPPPAPPIFGAAIPIKVSSDGDVTIYFKSRDGEQECDAVMNFL